MAQGANVDTRLELLRELERKATKGPWLKTDTPNDSCCWSYHVETEQRDARVPDYASEAIADVGQEVDADLIAAMRNALPALLAVVGVAQTVVGRVAWDRVGQDSTLWSLRTALATLAATGVLTNE